MMERLRILHLMALALLLAVTACAGGDASGVGAECVSDGDCAGELRCFDGICGTSSAGEVEVSSTASLPDTSPTTEPVFSTPFETAPDDYQTPCERDADCESRICLRTPEGGVLHATLRGR